MRTETCPKCGKKLNPHRSFQFWLGSNEQYYAGKLIKSDFEEGKNLVGVFNCPSDITVKQVNVGYDCATKINAEIFIRDGKSEVVTRKFKVKRK